MEENTEKDSYLKDIVKEYGGTYFKVYEYGYTVPEYSLECDVPENNRESFEKKILENYDIDYFTYSLF